MMEIDHPVVPMVCFFIQVQDFVLLSVDSYGGSVIRG